MSISEELDQIYKSYKRDENSLLVLDIFECSQKIQSAYDNLEHIFKYINKCNLDKECKETIQNKIEQCNDFLALISNKLEQIEKHI